mgnify:FL=1
MKRQRRRKKKKVLFGKEGIITFLNVPQHFYFFGVNKEV